MSLVLLAVACALAAATHSPPPSPSPSSPLVQPWVVSSSESVWSATLSVRAVSYDDGASRFVSRQYCLVDEAQDQSDITTTDGNVSRCGFPGPTIVFKAGDRVSLTVRNELEPSPAMPMPIPSNLPSKPRHDPNITNLHTHGLHVSTLVDSVFVRIAPGGAHTYHYRIPVDHAPGIGLYHAHTHGTVSLHMAGGLHGAFVVIPSLDVDGTVSSPPLPTPYAALPDPLLLVFSHVQLAPERVEDDAITQDCTLNADAPYDMFKSHSYAQLSRETGDQLFDFAEVGRNLVTDPADAGNELLWFSQQREGESFRRGNYYVVNGQVQPTLALVANRWTILQLVHAGGARTLDLDAPAACDMEVLAVDGVFLNHVAPRRRLHILPAGRYEVQMRCATTGTHKLLGAFFRHKQTLLTIKVTSDDHTQSSPSPPVPQAVTTADLASLPRPAYLTDLIDSDPSVISGESDSVNRFSFSFAFPQVGICPLKPHMIGAGVDCGTLWRGDLPSSTEDLVWTNQSASSVPVPVPNPCRFTEWAGRAQWGDGVTPVAAWNNSWPRSFVAPTGSLAEFSIYGMMVRGVNEADTIRMHSKMMRNKMAGEVAEYHPFHLHAHHVQVVSFTPTFDSDEMSQPDLDDHFLAPGTWRDTFATLEGELLVRFRVMADAGEVVLHCHTTRHEDHGMMTSFYACDNRTEGACPTGGPPSNNEVSSLFIAAAAVCVLLIALLIGCVCSPYSRSRDGFMPISTRAESDPAQSHPHPANVAADIDGDIENSHR